MQVVLNAIQTKMKFYRIEDTELLEDGVSVYSFYVLPESLEQFINMLHPFRDQHVLGEPVLVEVEENPKGGFLPIKGERNIYYFIGPG